MIQSQTGQFERSGQHGGKETAWTLWGDTGVGLHDRAWLTRGFGVVRAGSGHQPPVGAKHYLLTSSSRSVFEIRLGKLPGALKKSPAIVLHLQDRDVIAGGYRERVMPTESDGGVVVRRLYQPASGAVTRVVLTSDRSLAIRWSQPVRDDPERWLHQQGVRAEAVSVPASVHDGQTEDGISAWLSEVAEDDRLMRTAFSGIDSLGPRIWAHESVALPTRSRLVGPVFMGAGVQIPEDAVIVGPLVVTDRERAQTSDAVASVLEARDPKWNHWPVASTHPVLYRWSKRLFDIVVSACVLTLASPLLAFVAVGIMLEDGRPVLFGHKRQTLFGREFACLKFRSMVRNADAMQKTLRQQGANDADGPQFTLKNDPRILKFGHFIRKTHLDELPQFWNVLRGDMSIVGPRPSPDAENQYCPVWRETRLSVRAGITGLWQVRSTRRANIDFQEWIRYDIEYVQRRCWRLDLWIMFQTLRKCLPRWLGGRNHQRDDG
ncbi:MAG: sugar transferase [Phycisphaerales bacterium JB040]